MKKILLLSDTHSYIDDRISNYVSQADEVWHAGDIGTMELVKEIERIKPLKAVYGNIDNDKIRTAFPLDNRFFCEDVDVWITHIGGYPNRYNIRIRDEIKQNPPKLFITGHSHILKVMNDKNLQVTQTLKIQFYNNIAPVKGDEITYNGDSILIEKEQPFSKIAKNIHTNITHLFKG